jgi:hypothetical protein
MYLKLMSEQIIKSVVIIETIQNECISVSHGLLRKDNTRTAYTNHGFHQNDLISLMRDF